MLELGSIVKDLVTGMEGCLVATVDRLYGSQRVAVQPQGVSKSGLPPDEVWLDATGIRDVARVGIQTALVAMSPSGPMFAPGVEATDRVTGVSGIVVERTVWLTGWVRLGIQKQALHDGRPVEIYHIDEGRAELRFGGTSRFRQGDRAEEVLGSIGFD